MADNDSLIQQFTSISGVDIDRARFFLESAAWDLPTALSSFYEESNQPEGGEMDVAGAAALPPSSVMPASVPPVIPAAEAISKMEEEDSDSDEEAQAFYAGGSTRSGQQVLGPPKKKDAVTRLFKAAKEHGAEVLKNSGGEGRAKSVPFKGTSYRLGETSSDTQVIRDPNARPVEIVHVELNMWSDGFSIDDGPLRSYQDPENMQFLSEIKKGRNPLELIKKNVGKTVNINMNDRHHEEYVASRPQHKAFTGAGNTLGSPAPPVVGQVSQVAGPGGSSVKAPPSASEVKSHEEAAKNSLAVDESQPTTNVQVRLSDGSRLIIRANHSHTVGDLRIYLCTARPAYSALEFALMTTFPHAELTDSSATLKDANLLNSAIVAKNK